MTEWLLTLWAHLFHPRSLRLNAGQAEYVQGLLLGGASPEEIGRSMDRMYKRRSWLYLQSWDADSCRFVWPEVVAYDMDGLEYIRSAMIKLGAIKHKGRYDYYKANHPMTKVIAEAASKAPIPQSKGA